MENNSEINQPSTENKTQIVLNVPTKEDIVKSRWLSPTTYIIGFLFFFLTFCDISCSNQQLASLSGVNLVFGKEISNELMGDVETVPPNIWAIIAFAVCIIGIVLTIKKLKFENFLSFSVSVIGFLSLLILQITIKSSIDNFGEGAIRVGFKFAYWVVLLAFLINTFVSFLRIQNEKESIDSFKIFLKEFLQRKSGIVILGGIVFLFLFLIFNALYLNNPKHLGKKMIKGSIECRTKYYEDLLSNYKEVVNTFKLSDYTKKQQVRDKIDSIEKVCSAEMLECENLINEKHLKLKEKFKGNEKKARIYQQAIEQGNINVSSIFHDELKDIKVSLELKIKLIKDTEPDSYKIKNDLLRRKIGSWTFASLDEFLTFKVESTIKNSDRISFLCVTDMRDMDSMVDYFAKFYVSYKLANGEWVYNGLTEIFYDYKNSDKIKNDRIILEGGWQWPQNSAQYKSDGTWSGKWDDGKEINGRFKIIEGKLTLYDETGDVFASGNLDIINENEIELSDWSHRYTAKRISY